VKGTIIAKERYGAVGTKLAINMTLHNSHAQSTQRRVLLSAACRQRETSTNMLKVKRTLHLAFSGGINKKHSIDARGKVNKIDRTSNLPEGFRRRVLRQVHPSIRPSMDGGRDDFRPFWEEGDDRK
jgi:hypothetical protein